MYMPISSMTNTVYCISTYIANNILMCKSIYEYFLNTIENIRIRKKYLILKLYYPDQSERPES